MNILTPEQVAEIQARHDAVKRAVNAMPKIGMSAAEADRAALLASHEALQDKFVKVIKAGEVLVNETDRLRNELTAAHAEIARLQGDIQNYQAENEQLRHENFFRSQQ